MWPLAGVDGPDALDWNALDAVRELAGRFRRELTFPVVAVGGSNGKTTTKDLIAAVLTGGGRRVTKTRETMNGWSGIAATLLDRAHRRASPPDALVVEIGIDAPGAMAAHMALVDPDLALLTMIGAEHLAGLSDIDGVAREELVLLERARRRVLHVADPRIRAWAAEHARPDDVIVGPYARVESDPLTTAIDYDGRRFSAALAGAHNAGNLACAVAVGFALGRTAEDIAAGLAAFTAETMRCEVHRLGNDCVLIDDSYNASPPSMAAALELASSEAWRDRPLVLILGDMLDLGAASAEHHRALVPLVRRAIAERSARVIALGDAMAAVREEIPCEPLPDALDFPGAIVLVKASRGLDFDRIADTIRRLGFRTACVTGTNGKTTTTSLIAAIVDAAGEVSARVTTLGAWVAGVHVETEPSGAAFARTVRRAAAHGVRTLAIEASSQSLGRGFTKTWPAWVGVFTNLSRDHLDYHATVEDYLAAKAQLFMDLPPDGACVLNLADPSSALLHEVTAPSVRRLGYAARPIDEECTHLPVALVATDVTVDVDGTHAVLAPSEIGDALGGRLDLAVVGHVHVENALAAVLAAHALGYAFDAIRAGLAAFCGVPGRFEIVHRFPTVVVDYAHTPDALERTLATARALTARSSRPTGRVVVVFGCGGDRDPGKREEMGAIAAAGADEIVVTNDNPRSEDPGVIAAAIERGIGRPARRILDRAEAIRSVIFAADVSDIVVIAGKGHEKTQLIGSSEQPFDDAEVARSAAATRATFE